MFVSASIVCKYYIMLWVKKKELKAKLPKAFIAKCFNGNKLHLFQWSIFTVMVNRIVSWPVHLKTCSSYITYGLLPKNTLTYKALQRPTFIYAACWKVKQCILFCYENIPCIFYRIGGGNPYLFPGKYIEHLWLINWYHSCQIQQFFCTRMQV